MEINTIENTKLSRALSWNDLANDYDKDHNNRKARTLPMDSIFNWAASLTDEYKVDEKEGTIHRIIKNTKLNKTMRKIILVIYTTEKKENIDGIRTYAFNTTSDIQIGSLLKTNKYKTNLQVVDTINGQEAIRYINESNFDIATIETNPENFGRGAIEATILE